MRKTSLPSGRRANKQATKRAKDALVRAAARRRVQRKTLADLPIVTDPVLSAEVAGLVYVDDEGPGIRRRRAGRGMAYLGSDGRPVSPKDRARIEALRIPPAWTDVWICPLANGHIQATGRDERGRKQYRYHARWRTVRDETKYHRMIAFGHALATIREETEKALDLPGLSREKVLATVVRLLDWTHIRVGNDEYARENGSFGLTTMRDHHVAFHGDVMHFRFRGKSGKTRVVDVRDARLARIVRRCQDLPGEELFQYVDEGGEIARVHSGDVNDYLRRVTGQEFTAKDFRTWAGTVLAARELCASGPCTTKAQMKHNVVAAIDRVSQHLGNTRAVCKKCYVHPAVLDAYLDGSILAALTREVAALARLAEEEARVLAFLEERLALVAPALATAA
ncbi:MAG: DNA topoisomerase IB [Minicystis sp.]